MKIECIPKREDGTRVHFDEWPNEQFPDAKAPEIEYHFKPVDQKNPRSPHVAEVENEHHIARLLSISHAYRYFDDGSGSGFQMPTVAAPVPQTNVVPLKTAPKPEAGFDQAKVDAVRALSVKDLKKQINGFDDVTLRAALKIEQDRTDDAPRKTWIEVVEAQLGEDEEEEGTDD